MHTIALDWPVKLKGHYNRKRLQHPDDSSQTFLLLLFKTASCALADAEYQFFPLSLVHSVGACSSHLLICICNCICAWICIFALTTSSIIVSVFVDFLGPSAVACILLYLLFVFLSEFPHSYWHPYLYYMSIIALLWSFFPPGCCLHTYPSCLDLTVGHFSCRGRPNIHSRSHLGCFLLPVENHRLPDHPTNYM